MIVTAAAPDDSAALAVGLWVVLGPLLTLVLGAILGYLFGRRRDKQKALDELRASRRAIAARVHGELERLSGLVKREERRGHAVPFQAYAARYENLRQFSADLDAAIAASGEDGWRWLSFSLARFVSSGEELSQDGVSVMLPDLSVVEEIVTEIRKRLPVLEEPILDLPDSLALRLGQEVRALEAAGREAAEGERLQLLSTRDARPELFEALRDAYMDGAELGAQRLQWLLEEAPATDSADVPVCIGALADLLRAVRLPDVELRKIRQTVFAFLEARPDDEEEILRSEIAERNAFALGAVLLTTAGGWGEGDDLRTTVSDAFLGAVRAHAEPPWALLHDPQLRIIMRAWHESAAEEARAWALAQIEARDANQRLKLLDAFVVPVVTEDGWNLAFDAAGVEPVVGMDRAGAVLQELANGPLASRARHVGRAFRQADRESEERGGHDRDEEAGDDEAGDK